MAENKALTTSIEKKMKMSLDDLINESSKKENSQNSSTEKKRKITTTQRFSNKTQRPFRNPSSESRDRSSRVQRYMDSRSSHRHAAFALRRCNFHETSKFSVAIDTGRRATTTISAPPTYRQKPFNDKRIEKWNTRKEDRSPPVQRREARVYVAREDRYSPVERREARVYVAKEDRYHPPVQRREARVYVATRQWNDDHRRTMVPKQRHERNDQRRVVMPEQRHEYWKDQGRAVMPKHRHVEATKNKSVWQRLSGAPPRTQF